MLLAPYVVLGVFHLNNCSVFLLDNLFSFLF